MTLTEQFNLLQSTLHPEYLTSEINGPNKTKQKPETNPDSYALTLLERFLFKTQAYNGKEPANTVLLIKIYPN